MRTWRLTVELTVPASPAMPTEIGQTLVSESRVPEQARNYGDRRIRIRNAVDRPPNPLLPLNPMLKRVELLTEVEADDSRSAIRAFAPTLEFVVDLMSFQMGSVIVVGATDAIDVTPPVAEGDQRAIDIFADSPFDRNARLVEMEAIRGLLFGQLPDISIIGSSRVAAVLRWFVKALGTQLLHDQFIFLWIALEILSDDSQVKVESPYIPPCKHEILECPICKRSTVKKILGPSRKAFLEAYGVTPADSKRLWDMRQMMHGAIAFDSRQLDNLGALVQLLRAVVAAGLKDRLGIPADAPPLIAASGLTIHPAMSVNGTRVIDAKDLEPL